MSLKTGLSVSRPPDTTFQLIDRIKGIAEELRLIAKQSRVLIDKSHAIIHAGDLPKI